MFRRKKEPENRHTTMMRRALKLRTQEGITDDCAIKQRLGKNCTWEIAGMTVAQLRRALGEDR